MGWDRRPQDSILLVAREGDGFNELGGNIRTITEFADQLGARMVLHSLATIDRCSHKLKWKDVFGTSTGVAAVIFESENWTDESDQEIELWQRSKQTPTVFRRRVSRCSDSQSLMKTLMAEFPRRVVLGNKLLVICGETAIVRVRNDGKKTIVDDFGFLKWLDGSQVQVFLNPLHDFMARWNCREKRRIFSKSPAGKRRFTVSIWNRNLQRKIAGPKYPWSVDYGGKDVTNLVQNIDGSHIRADLRIGLLEIPC